MTQQQYQECKKTTVEQRQILEAKSKKISLLRFFIFLLGAFSIWGALQYRLTFLIVTLALILLFIYIAKKHRIIDENIAYACAKEDVLQRYIDRFHDVWKTQPIETASYFPLDDSIAQDLDLFGEASLYQYISSANTIYGQKSLIHKLHKPTLDKKYILTRQHAVKELIEKQDFAINFETYGRRIPTKSKNMDIIDAFIQVTKGNDKFQAPLLSYLKWILPIVLFVFLFLNLTSLYPNTLPLRILLFLQLVISLGMYMKNKLLFVPVFAFIENIKPYQAMLSSIEREDFHSEYLIELQSRLSGKHSASSATKSLSKISEAIKFRFNFIAFILLNSLFMWELHCVDRFSQWCKQYSNDIQNWLETIGEIEALISLANLAHAKSETCFPSISSNEAQLSFQGLSHPLISDADAVGNDFEIQSTTCIITGSNMSGKTTFLRTIGINLIIAYAGGPVCAQYFDSSLMRLFTSIRVKDSVDKGISTFYAELLRIKEMVYCAKEKQPMITLIDEIFNGTNSKDRIIGAKETIRQLHTQHSLSFVTTHDLELGQLQQLQFVNYHFSEYYKENKIYFDYKIKEGISQTTNAQYLLQMVGIMKGATQ